VPRHAGAIQHTQMCDECPLALTSAAIAMNASGCGRPQNGKSLPLGQALRALNSVIDRSYANLSVGKPSLPGGMAIAP